VTDEPELARDVLIDVLRSAWVVEHGRARVYRTWEDSRRAAIAEERADLVERPLSELDSGTDLGLIDSHTEWIHSLVGRHPDEVPLGSLLLARLGDWVTAHTVRFLGDNGKRMEELGEEERSTLEFPSSLPAAPDFERLRAPDAEPPGPTLFRVGILGDAHIGAPGSSERVRAAIADLNSSGAELVIQLGDITDMGEEQQFEEASEILSGLQMPFATMMGNHDVWSKSEERLSGRDYYETHFGREPEGVLLEHKGFRLAVLDSIEHGASPFGPFDLVTGSFTQGPRGAIVRGALTSRQHDLLADVAAPEGGPAFVFLHHPPQPFWAFPPIVFGLRDADTGRLHAVADSGNVWGVFAGHTHRCARTREFDGVPSIEVGSPRDFPFGYALLDVSEQGYAYRFHQLSDEETLRAGYKDAGTLMRRYGTGPPEARAFTWNRPPG
jgi:hypothetical protein